jgi:hypothetical protein
MTTSMALRVAVLGGLLLAAGVARADGAWANGGGRLSLQAVGGVAPTIAGVRAGWYEQWALPEGEGILWSHRDASAGLTLGVTPASAQLGLEASVVPIAFLELSAGYQVCGFFGTFGSLWRAPSRHAPFGDGDIRDGDGRPGMEHRLRFTPSLRARFGRLVLRNESELTLIALSRGRGWYRTPAEDTLVASRDLILSDQLAALVEAWRGTGRAGILVGPAAEITWAARADLTRVRVGGIAVLTLANRLGGLSRPRLFAWAGAATRDRNRAGEPFAVFGLSGDVDVAPSVTAAGGGGGRP